VCKGTNSLMSHDAAHNTTRNILQQEQCLKFAGTEFGVGRT